jgi:hypothetical protein
MLSLDELSKQASAYVDVEAFEQWFRDNSWGSYDRPSDPLSAAIAAVEMALSSYSSEEIDEDELREELANALHPFVVQSPTASVIPIKIVHGKSFFMSAGTASPWHQRTFSAEA